MPLLKRCCIAVVLAILLHQSAMARPDTNRKSIHTSLSGPLFGLYQLSYEHQLSIKQSVLLNVGGWNWKDGNKEGNAVGYGIAYRYYFNRPLDGYFYGLGINILDMAAYKNKGETTEVAERNNIFYPYFEAGHAFFLPRNFQLTVNMRSYFGIGQLRDTDYPYFGFFLVPNLSIGYRF